MIVPKVSTNSGFHAVWPGLENTANNFVYQNVIADSKTPGQWNFFVEYCCKCVFWRQTEMKHTDANSSPNVEYPAVKGKVASSFCVAG